MWPGVHLHNKLNWTNKNTEREKFHFPMPFSITDLSQAVCSLLYQHRQYNSHNVSWSNALVWQNTHIYLYTHTYVHAHVSLQHSLDTTISYIVSDLDQYTETSSAVHSKQMVGMSSKEEETEPLPPATGNG